MSIVDCGVNNVANAASTANVDVPLFQLELLQLDALTMPRLLLTTISYEAHLGCFATATITRYVAEQYNLIRLQMFYFVDVVLVHLKSTVCAPLDADHPTNYITVYYANCIAFYSRDVMAPTSVQFSN